MLFINWSLYLWILLFYVWFASIYFDLQLPPLAPNVLFLKSSRCVFLLLPTPFTSVICISLASRRKQFLLRIWPIQLAFLLSILFRSVLFSPIRSRTCSLVRPAFSDQFRFYLLHSPPAPHFKALHWHHEGGNFFSDRINLPLFSTVVPAIIYIYSILSIFALIVLYFLFIMCLICSCIWFSIIGQFFPYIFTPLSWR